MDHSARTRATLASSDSNALLIFCWFLLLLFVLLLVFFLVLVLQETVETETAHERQLEHQLMRDGQRQDSATCGCRIELELD
jgi:hypothetical protein